jgi:hypothetical protein
MLRRRVAGPDWGDGVVDAVRAGCADARERVYVVLRRCAAVRDSAAVPPLVLRRGAERSRRSAFVARSNSRGEPRRVLRAAAWGARSEAIARVVEAAHAPQRHGQVERGCCAVDERRPHGANVNDHAEAGRAGGGGARVRAALLDGDGVLLRRVCEWGHSPVQALEGQAALS